MDLILQGALIGVALAAPVGPVGVLCIRLALTQGRFAAVIAGLGAAVADTVFGAAAGLGLVILQTFIAENQVALSLFGAFIVVGLGIATLRTPITFEDRPTTLATLSQDFATTFTLAITNPATMIAAFGLFAALGPLNTSDTRTDGALLVGGVFLGSAGWWVFLAGVTGLFRHQLRTSLVWLNRLFGGLLLLFGAVLIGRVITNSL